jgi:DNA-binding MarR family transcriptional regulator
MSDLPVTPSLALDEQLCFALYSASRAVTGRYRALLEEFGLTYPQYLVLLVLWESGPVTVGQLGQRLHLDSGTLSPLLKRLEAAGMIARRRSRTDERAVEVSLTGAGHRLRERAECLPAAIGEASGMPVAELIELTARLRVLTENVRAATD